MLRALLLSVVGTCFLVVAHASSPGTPVSPGPAFPTSLFSSMYYMPSKPTAEPRPAVPRLGGGWFPDALNNPTELPSRAPASEAVLPAPLHDTRQVKALVDDVMNAAHQLVRGGDTSLLCNVCRTELSTLQTLAHVDPELVPDVLTGVCRTLKLFGGTAVSDQCALTFDRAMYGGPITQVMSYGNFSGNAPDATLVCAAATFCERPSEALSDAFLDDWFHGSRAPSHATLARWRAKQAHAQAHFDESALLPVLHISDLHVDGRYMVGSESNCTFGETRYCCHSLSANSALYSKPITHGTVPRANISAPAGYWGNYTCDAPWSLIGSAFQAIRHVGGERGYELALFTGDLALHDDLFRYSHDLILYSAQALFGALKGILGRAPLFATLGNHETSPENFYAPHNLPDGRGHQFDWDSDYLARLWRSLGWLDAHGEQDVRTHYGGFSVSPRRGLRVISMNSDFWYFVNVFNYIHSTNPDLSGMFRFLTDELFAAEARGERVWILGHVATGWDGSQSLEKPSNLFYQIVSRFAPHTIAAIFFGHTHQDHFSVFYRATSGRSADAPRRTAGAVTVALNAPSVTPESNVNPSFRVYLVDPTTYDIYDWDQYYTDVDAFATSAHGPVWHHLYRARDTYGDFHASVQDGQYTAHVALDGTHWPRGAPLNATFWSAVTDEMEARPELLTTFSRLQSRRSSRASVCTDHDCRRANVCYMRSATAAQGRSCPSGFGSVV